MSTESSGTLVEVRQEDPGLADDVGAGSCGERPDLAGLDDAQVMHVLVGQTARFTTSFLRWMDGRACDGLNFARLSLLQALHCGGPAIMRDLGTQLGATPRNMTAIVDAMELAGLVVRRPHPTDRRATMIELSEAGERAATLAIGPQLDAISEIFAGLTPVEREHFSAAMTKLMQAMKDREQRC